MFSEKRRRIEEKVRVKEGSHRLLTRESCGEREDTERNI